MKVTRSIYIEHQAPKGWGAKETTAASWTGHWYTKVSWSSYVSNHQPIILEGVGTEQPYFRRSEDNGKTWERCGEWDATDWTVLPPGQEVKLLCEPMFYLDPDNDKVLRIYTERNHVTSDFWSQFRDIRAMYQMSSDAGRTWGAPVQIVQKGKEYHPAHWAKDVYCDSKNGGMCECSSPALKLKDGSICLPFERYTPQTHGEKNIKFIPGCLLGRWHDDQIGIEWDLGEYVSIDERLSSVGGDEPAIAELSDGRLFMIMRTTKSQISSLPSFAYYAVSNDHGRTWSEAKVLAQPDGTLFYTPACMPAAFCSSKNGRLYVITTFLEHAAREHVPRYPLQIAEIDQDKMTIIPETMTVIENRAPDQPEYVCFSNFRYREDRDTSNLVLLMSTTSGGQGPRPNGGLPQHSYRYDIEIPER